MKKICDFHPFVGDFAPKRDWDVFGMKKRTRAVASLFHVSARWACVSLIPLVVVACKPRPLVCEPESFFQVLQPEEGAGAAPFSIERLGPKLKNTDVATVPGMLVLKNNGRASVSWDSGDFVGGSELIFSPSEGLARDVEDPQYVYPMRRFSDGASERVRFGFRSHACRSPRQFGVCDMVGDALFLAAEMQCHPEQERR